MWARRLVLVLAVVAAGLLFLWLQSDDPAPEEMGETALTDVEVPAEGAREGRGAKRASPIATVEFGEKEGGGSAGETAARQVVLRGRCVEGETEAPLAGCRVAFRGWEGNYDTVQEYEQEHGDIAWENPEEQLTKPDGRFEFRIVPPPPYQFAISIEADARIALQARWFELEPGTIHDCGDIPMHRGVRVSGSVLDAEGTAPGKAVVRLALIDRQGLRDGFHPRKYRSARTRKDGTFAVQKLLSQGTWRVSVDDMKVVNPKSLEIDGSSTAEVLDIRIRRVEKIETISGVVVDDVGNPVPNAEVEIQRCPSATMAKRDGTFTLKRDIRSSDPDGPLVLEARQRGYETGRTTEEVSWGDDGVNIVLRSGLAVEIIVIDGETGEPVEDFSVRFFADPATTSRHTGSEYQLRERGHHPGGVLLLKGQTRGRRYVIVHPTDAGYGHSAGHAFTVTDAGAPRQTIPVFDREPARIKVVRPDGTPVAYTYGARLDSPRCATDC